MKDSIVDTVIQRFKDRSEVGIIKYKKTLDRTDLSEIDWINHAQEEAMDLILYLEKLKTYKEKGILQDYPQRQNQTHSYVKITSECDDKTAPCYTTTTTY